MAEWRLGKVWRGSGVVDHRPVWRSIEAETYASTFAYGTPNPIGLENNGDEYSGWYGRRISIGHCPVSRIDHWMIAETVHHWSTDPDDWDGSAAAVIRLVDGRYVTWETMWGPTGNGFSADAYGGNTDVFYAWTYGEAVRWGLSDEARRNMGVPQP